MPHTIKVIQGTIGKMSESLQTKLVFDEFEYDPIEERLDKDPGSYFLSPIDEEDEDDGEEIEWDAGIDDFALYAEERSTGFMNKPKDKWHRLEDSQQQALERALARAQADSAPVTQSKPPAADEIPGLTPDHSPRLQDNLEMPDPMPKRPHYVTVIVTPPDEDDEEDDAPLFMRSYNTVRVKHRVPRPGLRHTRTLSGKHHSWSRPSFHLYTVEDQPEEEEKRAERAPILRRSDMQDDDEDAQLAGDDDDDIDSLISDPDKVFEEVDGVQFEMLQRRLARDVYEEGV